MDVLTTSLMGKQKKKKMAYVEDSFSSYVYTGTEAVQSIVNDIDLATDGGVTWIKNRSIAVSNILTDTERGAGQVLYSDSTAAEYNLSSLFTSFNTDGFSITGSAPQLNALNDDYISWTFKKQPRFFYQEEVVKGVGVDKVVDLSSLSTVGMVAVKRTDSTGSWYVWHKDLTTGSLLNLDTTAAEAVLGQITVSGTNLTLEDGVIADGTYIVYAWAHDPLGASGDGSDGMIACGTYTGNGTSTPPEIDLGWEPQLVMTKSTLAAGGSDTWFTFDNIRGFCADGCNDAILNPNSTAAESATNTDYLTPISTGFKAGSSANGIFGTNTLNETYIYMAIRRPMKTPESGTEVFAIDTKGSVDSNKPGFRASFPVDMSFGNDIDSTTTDFKRIASRLTGANELIPSATNAEYTGTNYTWDFNNGIYENTTTDATSYSWMFKRAKGFFDVVCYTGDGIPSVGVRQNLNHNLDVVPEMVWHKRRDSTSEWQVVHANDGINAKTLYLNLSNASVSNITMSTYFDETTFDVEEWVNEWNNNVVGGTYIAYLFATLAGISKVGSYTGNGSSQTIDCGFSAGARFVLVKASSTTGDWMFWDALRGIVAGTESYLELNTTNAEVTTEDAIDPESTGFIVNEVTGSNINTNTVEYIFYAIA